MNRTLPTPVSRLRISLILLSLAVFAAAMAGCAAGLTRPDPERRHYLLQAQRSTPPGEHLNSGEILAVRTFRTAPAYDSRSIVALRPGGLAERNFYERFFLPPGEMLSGQFRQWLGQSGLFVLVTDLGGMAEPDLILEGFIQELYQDLRGGPPKAVLALQLLLLRPRPSGEVEVVRQENLRRALELPDASVKTLVAGWNLALEQILLDVEVGLRENVPSRLDATIRIRNDLP